MQQWHAPTEYLQVDNRLAREAIETAYKAAGLRESQLFGPYHLSDGLQPQLVDAVDAVAMREEIRQQLNRSGLAYLIPGGRYMLPDIYQGTHPLLRPLVHLFEPRNTKQLVGHIARNLDWYLSPTSRPFYWRRLRGLLASPLMAILLCRSLTLLMTRGDEGFAIALFYLTALIIIGGCIWHITNDAERYRDKINAYELYLYLRESYSEPLTSSGSPPSEDNRNDVRG